MTVEVLGFGTVSVAAKCGHIITIYAGDVTAEDVDAQGFWKRDCTSCAKENEMQDLVKRLMAKKIPTRGVFALCRAAAKAIKDLEKHVIAKDEVIVSLSEQLSATDLTYRGLSAHAAELEKAVSLSDDTMKHLEGVLESSSETFKITLAEKDKLIFDAAAVNNALTTEVQRLAAPVPLILKCPECGTRHVDVGVWAAKPHHTHACQGCGHVWRPAIADTVGVMFLPGFKNGPETYAS